MKSFVERGASLAAGVLLATGGCTSAPEALPSPDQSQEYPIVTALASGRISVGVLVVPDESSTFQQQDTRDAWNFKRLLAGKDQEISGDVRESWETATYGRVQADVAKPEVLPPFSMLGDCLDVDNALQSDQLQGLVAQHEKQTGKKYDITYIVVGADGCEIPEDIAGEKGQKVGGYAASERDPAFVVIAGNGGDDLTQFASHEGGHSAGLGHAATADCKVPAKLQACTIDPVGDDGSVMGYGIGEHFSPPELYYLGRMTSREVQQAKPGTYVIGSLEGERQSATKLLTYTTPDDTTIFISNDPDLRAKTGPACKPQVSEYVPLHGVDADKCYLVPLDTDTTRSVQLRYDDHNRDDVITHVYPQANGEVMRPWGATKPNAVLYEDDRVIITFRRFDADDNAVVDFVEK